MSTLQNLTAQMALLHGGVSTISDFLEKASDESKKSSKKKSSGVSHEETTADNTAKLVESDKLNTSERKTDQKTLIKSQKDANVTLLEGFGTIQTQVIAAIDGLVTHTQSDAQMQRLQSVTSIKQAWDSHNVAKQTGKSAESSLIAQGHILHFAQQSYVAQNQIATEIVKFHGFMAADGKEQTKLRIHEMKIERHNNLQREQRIQVLLSQSNVHKGFDKYTTRSQLESYAVDDKGPDGRQQRAKDVIAMTNAGTYMKSGRNWNDDRGFKEGDKGYVSTAVVKGGVSDMNVITHSLKSMAEGDGNAGFTYMENAEGGLKARGLDGARQARTTNMLKKLRMASALAELDPKSNLRPDGLPEWPQADVTMRNTRFGGVPPNLEVMLTKIFKNISISGGGATAVGAGKGKILGRAVINHPTKGTFGGDSSGTWKTKGQSLTPGQIREMLETDPDGLRKIIGDPAMDALLADDANIMPSGIIRSKSITAGITKASSIGMAGAASNPCCEGIDTLVISNAEMLKLMENKELRDIQLARDIAEAKNDANNKGKNVVGGSALLNNKDGGGGFWSAIGGALAGIGAGTATAVATGVAGVGTAIYNREKIKDWAKKKIDARNAAKVEKANKFKNKTQQNRINQNNARKTKVNGDVKTTSTSTTPKGKMSLTKGLGTAGLVIEGMLIGVDANDKMNEGQGGLEAVTNATGDFLKNTLGFFNSLGENMGPLGNLKLAGDIHGVDLSASNLGGKSDIQKYIESVIDTPTTAGTEWFGEGNRKDAAPNVNGAFANLSQTQKNNQAMKTAGIYGPGRINQKFMSDNIGGYGPQGFTQKEWKAEALLTDEERIAFNNLNGNLRTTQDQKRLNQQKIKSVLKNRGSFRHGQGSQRLRDGLKSKGFDVFSDEWKKAQADWDGKNDQLEDLAAKYRFLDQETVHSKKDAILAFLQKASLDDGKQKETLKNLGFIDPNAKKVVTPLGALNPDNVPPGKHIVTTPSGQFIADDKVTTTPIAKPTIDISRVMKTRKAYNQGFSGMDQFMHGMVNKNTSSGFMGFNPIRSMAHGQVSNIMGQFKNPDNVTPEMVYDTRAMIKNKATSMLGPDKANSILEQFDQFIKTLGDYKDSKVINANDKVEKTFYEKALHPGSIYTNDIHVTGVLDSILSVLVGGKAHAGWFGTDAISDNPMDTFAAELIDEIGKGKDKIPIFKNSAGKKYTIMPHDRQWTEGDDPKGWNTSKTYLTDKREYRANAKSKGATMLPMDYRHTDGMGRTVMKPLSPGNFFKNMNKKNLNLQQYTPNKGKDWDFDNIMGNKGGGIGEVLATILFGGKAHAGPEGPYQGPGKFPFGEKTPRSAYKYGLWKDLPNSQIDPIKKKLILQNPHGKFDTRGQHVGTGHNAKTSRVKLVDEQVKKNNKFWNDAKVGSDKKMANQKIELERLKTKSSPTGPKINAGSKQFDLFKQFFKGPKGGSPLMLLIPLMMEHWDNLFPDSPPLQGDMFIKKFDSYTNLTPQMASGGTGAGGGQPVIINNNQSSNVNNSSAIVANTTAHAPALPSGVGSSISFV